MPSKIEELESALDQLQNYIESSIASGKKFSQKAKDAIRIEVEETIAEINRLRQAETAPSNELQLLWILGGQKPEAFVSYLNTFPSAQTKALLANPSQLKYVVNQLSQMMPSGQLPVIGGIQQADLASSNIWGTNYNPKSNKMQVRFQNGSVYEYDGVPEYIYNAFISGSAAAKTNGKNKFGYWWQGKTPSLGAALNQYIKASNFPYRKIR